MGNTPVKPSDPSYVSVAFQLHLLAVLLNRHMYKFDDVGEMPEDEWKVAVAQVREDLRVLTED